MVKISELGWKMNVHYDDYPRDEGRYGMLISNGKPYNLIGMSWSGMKRTVSGWKLGWTTIDGKYGWWVWKA